MNSRVRLVFLALLGVCGIVLFILGVAHAHADPVQTITTDEQVWADYSGGAESICHVFDQYGVNIKVAVTLVYAINSTKGYPIEDGPPIINYSVYRHCSRHWPALVALGETYRSGKAA